MRITCVMKLIGARIGATLLWFVSNTHYRIGKLWLMYSGFENEEQLAKQRAVVDAAVARFYRWSNLAKNGLRYILFLQHFLGRANDLLITRKGLSFLFVRYEQGVTDDEDILTAMFMDYSIRFAKYIDGQDAMKSKQAGLCHAIEYLVKVDPSGEKSKRYRFLENLFN